MKIISNKLVLSCSGPWRHGAWGDAGWWLRAEQFMYVSYCPLWRPLVIIVQVSKQLYSYTRDNNNN